MKKNLIRLVAGAAILAGLAWTLAAAVRLHREHRSFINTVENRPEQFWYSESELTDFVAHAKLKLGSLSPLMKCPWRDDVRLYYTYRGAYAFRDSTHPWEVKWP
jgi:hypothetical protein